MTSVVMAMSCRACANALDQVEIFFGGVGAMHRFEDSIRTGLDRQMNDARRVSAGGGKRLDQIVAKSDRMRAR